MKSRKTIIAVLILVALIAGWIFLIPSNHGTQKKEANSEKGIALKESVAKEMGIKTAIAGSVLMEETLPLTGQILLNQNTKADIKARFPGIVREVNVQLGEEVKKGQTLARVESNDSLQTYGVTSPIDGVLLVKNTNPGDVAADTPLFTVADLSDVWAEFYIFPRDMPRIKKDMLVKIHALDATGDVTAPISLMLPTADALSQTIIATVIVPNPNGVWRPGMSVEGAVVLSKQEVHVAVEEAAIQRIGNDSVIFVRNGETYLSKKVRTGKRSAGIAEIIEGLDSGEEYVSVGSFILKSELGKATMEDDD